MSRNQDEIEPKIADIVHIGGMVFDISTGQLRDAKGCHVPLRSQSAEVLADLARHPGQVIAKDALIAAVWPDRFVTDDSLVQCITDIRRALGESGHQCLLTYPRRGYRLVATPAPETPPSRVARNRPSVLVCRFQDVGVGDDKGFLSNAIPEAIALELSRFSEFSVARQWTGATFHENDPEDVTRTAVPPTNFIVCGTQQKSSNRLRVAISLIDAFNDETIWAERFEQSLADLFAAQDLVAGSVAASIGAIVAFRPPSQRLQSASSSMHYHILARGAFRAGGADNAARALTLNSLAVEADPTAACGYIGLCFVYTREAEKEMLGIGASEAIARSREASRRALALEPNNYDSHNAAAWLLSVLGEHDMSIARYERAMELNPNAGNVRAAASIEYVFAGRYATALDVLQVAIRSNPAHPAWYDEALAWVQWHLGDHQAALKAILRSTEFSAKAFLTQAAVLQSVGDSEGARLAVSEALALNSGLSVSEVRGALAHRYADAGMLGRWLVCLRAAGLPE